MKSTNENNIQLQEITNLASENISTLYKNIIITLILLGGLSLVAVCISIYTLDNTSNHFNLIVTIIFGINAIAFFLLAKFLNKKKILKENDYKKLLEQSMISKHN